MTKLSEAQRAEMSEVWRGSHRRDGRGRALDHYGERADWAPSEGCPTKRAALRISAHWSDSAVSQ